MKQITILIIFFPIQMTQSAQVVISNNFSAHTQKAIVHDPFARETDAYPILGGTTGKWTVQTGAMKVLSLYTLIHTANNSFIDT